jgi:hypothetical protein
MGGREDFSHPISRSLAPTPALDECAEKDRLLRACIVSGADYSRAVAVLAEFVGVMNKARYDLLKKFSEVARLKSKEARRVLELHMIQHGC